MTRLLVDLGNTRLKWAWLDDGAVQPTVVHAAPHLDDGWIAPFADALATIATPPRDATIAAVGPVAHVTAVRAALAARWPALAVEEVVTPAIAHGIRVAYDEPARMGVDRFLALVGARAQAPGAVVTVGVGTALALDVVASDGTHLGGLITPTAPRMRDAVLGHTARVAWRDAPAITTWGRRTEDALWSGCWQALAALVDRAHATATRELGETPRLVLHGGDAATLASLVERPCEIAPDLVIHGLARHVAAH